MRVSCFLNLCVLTATASPVSLAIGQNITIETDVVGDAGNPGQDSTGYGAVNYRYSIGRYEVTNAQYAAFLNAKAATDTHGLYNTGMAGAHGGIIRAGAAGSYNYSTVSGRENWPVNFVSFWDAARFTNWLENGQGTGDTESGTYTLTVSGITSNTVTRNPGSTWVIPSQDEWFKAAYFAGYASGSPSMNGRYWDYPVGFAVGTSANYDNLVGTLTAVGSYARYTNPFSNLSFDVKSTYGSYDMAGNVQEWNETEFAFARGMRGGSFSDSHWILRNDASSPFSSAGSEIAQTGFRVAQIPGPGPIAVMVLGRLLTRVRRRAER